MLWLQPLTYTFRLLIREEFSTCSDFSRQDKQLLDCVEAFENGAKTFEGKVLETIYGQESVLTLTAGGEYFGREAILEYLAYFSRDQDAPSILWDFCGVRLSPVGLTVCIKANTFLTIDRGLATPQGERSW